MKIRIFEITQQVTGFQPSGREIYMESDSPFFLFLGPQGQEAIRTGAVGINRAMFEQVVAIIKESE